MFNNLQKISFLSFFSQRTRITFIFETTPFHFNAKNRQTDRLDGEIRQTHKRQRDQTDRQTRERSDTDKRERDQTDR